jgi:hypothetical protein
MVAVPPQIPTNLTQLKPERRRRETYALLLELAELALKFLARKAAAEPLPDVVEELVALSEP